MNKMHIDVFYFILLENLPELYCMETFHVSKVYYLLKMEGFLFKMKALEGKHAVL